MAITTSKYSNKQIEQMLTEMVDVLDKHRAPADLSLMLVGNIATNVLNQEVPAEQRKIIAEKFAQALFSSLDTPKTH
ncbi:YejL family protein [Aliivibrio sp. S3MY1]|uniref:YejL family protein n=1 Tax=Aliivibrio TaxID=511678 RepID=UPI002379B70A|nr:MULTISPECIES: YejL family protein [unclassified Aliivibrio]MDD9196461.1 YejL family protein [Aliivibrio sp. S3MY1]MDD9199146.1 YejL family protein [Aliivibrio sp. S2MY1]